MKKINLDLPIFVPKDKEDIYFEKNNITYEKLSNGIVFLLVSLERLMIYMTLAFNTNSTQALIMTPQARKGFIIYLSIS